MFAGRATNKGLSLPGNEGKAIVLHGLRINYLEQMKNDPADEISKLADEAEIGEARQSIL